VQDPETGNVIDRYVIPRRTTVPVRQTVPELQKITTLKNTTVPEVRTIQVPVERMVPEEYTEMEVLPRPPALLHAPARGAAGGSAGYWGALVRGPGRLGGGAR
jgi:hypothetical protein